MILFFQPHIPDGIHYLDAEESKHCTKVLRKKSGDAITITDGKGSFYDAVITDIQKERCHFTITQQRKEPPHPFHIHIAIAPTKHTDRMEWFVEKAVETGVDKISFIFCKNSERTRFKTDRVERIALSAMKQSLKATRPEITEPVAFTDFITQQKADEKFIAYVDGQNPHHLFTQATAGKSYCILIGPEGDFSPDELSLANTNGYQTVSLGPNRLRTETAGLLACHTLLLRQ